MTVQPRPGAGSALVSVIIRTCNRLDFLRRALTSLTEQTWPSLEVVVVNDGSDPVDHVCNEFRDQFSALVITSPDPGGDRVRAANTGLEKASGDYFIFLDDDDWFLPNHIQKLAEAIASNPDCGVVYTGVECVRLNQKTGQFSSVHHYNQPFDSAALLLRNFIPMHAALFRRTFVDAGLRFDESLTHYEDWDFWLQLHQKTTFTYIPGTSAIYYLGEASGFGIEDSPEQLANEDKILEKWRHLWSARDVRNIVDYARRLPAANQNAHDLGIGLRESQQEKNKLRLHLAASREQQKQLMTELRDIRARYEYLSAEYELVIKSRSWKITAPLRSILSKLRGDDHDHQPMPGADEQALADIKPLDLILVDSSNRHTIVESIALPVEETPVVSVIIPVFNQVDLTLACLQSITNCPSQWAFEVIVVDDASSDDTQTLLSQIPNLVYLRQGANKGFVASCNAGAEQARGDYLLFLNNDTQVTDLWLDALVDTMEFSQTIGIAGSRLVYPSGYLQEAGVSLHQDGSVTLIGLNQNPNDRRYSYAREVDHCSGAAMMIRSDIFRELKGFDPAYAPAYFEDCDLSLRVRQLGYSIYYQPLSTIIHHLSATTNTLATSKIEQIERNRKIYLDKWESTLQEMDKIRLIAFYLPQYHTIPENDAWWGKGFTEWTNVTRATPLYSDHYQPHEPADLGYYNLQDEQVRIEQARLARQYGIYGFCYYYYWFSGKRLLEKPLQDMLDSGKPDFPFCLCWANENWTRRWDGRDDEILIAQDYTEQDARVFIDELIPVLRDKRYIRVHNKPLLLIYRADEIPRLEETVALWRRTVLDAGFDGLFLAAVASFQGVDTRERKLIDAVVEFPPHGGYGAGALEPDQLDPDFDGQLFDYPTLADTYMNKAPVDGLTFRGVMPSWDNTARRGSQATVFLNSSPQHYGNWLKHVVTQTRHNSMGDERLVFVNAWNEWAEGNHLEPDKKYGHAWLKATRTALGKMGYYNIDNDIDDVNE